MKLRILSDIHYEFGPWELPVLPNEDEMICILAGDIGLADKQYTYLDFVTEMNDRFKTVIYIMGNHEHYRSNFPQTYNKLVEATKDLENVVILENETIIIDGIAFICASLWSDFEKGNPLSMMEAQAVMNDFRTIRTGPKAEPWKRKLTPNDVYSVFDKSKNYIFSELTKHKKAVVVTHHAPSHQSSEPKYRSSNTRGAFASSLENEIIDNGPILWIHGHMHSSSDYMIGDTRILCNARGYPGEAVQGFDPKLVVEV